MCGIMAALTLPTLATEGVTPQGYIPYYADYDGPIHTLRQEWLHYIAMEARVFGEPEDGPIIRALQEEWWKEQEKLNIVAKVIQNEADPEWCDWEHSVAVGAVVMNRVASPYFPDTVKEVVGAPGQYASQYTYGFTGLKQKSYAAAKAAIDGDHNVPSNAYWQANFPQGTSTWKTFICDTGWFYSVTYICCGIPGID